MLPTKRLFDEDAYLTEFEATVLSCTETETGFEMVIDQTAFFPEGGGQPADMGTLGGVKVLDVHEKDDIVTHTTDKPLEVGAEVQGEIDWERRFDLMQNHSGEHILSGVICAKYGCDNVGFHMGKEMITIVDKSEYKRLMDYIRRVDPKAFVTVYSVSEINYTPKVKK